MVTEKDLQTALLHGRITRREFVKLSVAMGISLTSIGAFLAACSPAPVAPTAPASSAPAVGAATVAPAPTSAPPTAAQKLTLAGAKDILNLDPLQVNDADSTYVFGQIHDSVAVIDHQYNVKPNVAEKWQVSDDGLTYVYTFRKGVKFHDGSELKSDDVVFTLDRIMANKFPEGRKKEKIDMIASYKKVDDYTVEIKLKSAYAPFAAAFGNMLIVPKAVVEKVGDAEFGKRPVGCGPFKLAEWTRNDHVALAAFPDYWLTKPKLSQFIIRPIPENAVAVANLLAGDVDAINDVAGANLKQLQGAANKGIVVLNKPSMTYCFIGFRMSGPPFTDPRFRQAIYMATDFDATIKALFPPELAVRAYGPIPPGMWPQDDEYLKSNAYKRDPDKAKALFKQLIDEGVMPKDYVVTIAPPPDDVRIRVSEVMATNLKELGINAEITRLDWTAYTPMLEQSDKNVIYMLATTASIPDPDASIRWLFSKDGAHGRYLKISQFKEYEGWGTQITKAQFSSKQEERAQIYRDLARTMMKQVFHIPLYYKNAVMAKRTYVKDLDVDPMYAWDIVKPWANVSIEGKPS